ncbi:hypothetical protein OIU84_004467 [Salix udensis]|uniref:Uncharacterized protein n=1 Tax=Salix udensis TaxID=889485 RepID=A0AAD6K268_9ROSI|nr:hypothetical protein OIU84_004467 [Salix udensis]
MEERSITLHSGGRAQTRRCQEITLDDLGVKELAFRHGNKPAHVSCWIGSAVDGLVMAIPSSNEKNTSDFNVMVTIPEGN